MAEMTGSQQHKPGSGAGSSGGGSGSGTGGSQAQVRRVCGQSPSVLFAVFLMGGAADHSRTSGAGVRPGLGSPSECSVSEERSLRSAASRSLTSLGLNYRD